jgi:hypothetical protein
MTVAEPEVRVDEEARPGIELVRTEMTRARGRLFELIELAALPQKQEEAFKRLVRRATYDLQAGLEAILRERL